MKRPIAILLALVLLLSAGLLAGCGGKAPGKMKLTAEKAASVENEKFWKYRDAKTAFIYEDENGTYSLVSYDGKTLTEPQPYIEQADKGYFKVGIAELPKNEKDFERLNTYGLLNPEGEEIIPRKYAEINVLNDTYAVAMEAAGTTDDWSKKLFEVRADEWFDEDVGKERVYFTGNWTLYNLKEKAPVEGVSGTEAQKYINYGDVFGYKQNDGTFRYIRPDGTALPEKIEVLTNGSYRMTDENGVYALYAIDGTKLFDIDEDGYVPRGENNGYYIGENYVDDHYSYVLLDEKGKQVAGPFEDGNFTFVGDILIADKKIFDLSGNVLLDEKADECHVETERKKGAMLFTADNRAIIYDLETKEVIYNEEKVDGYDYNYAACDIREIGEQKSRIYSWADRDFTFTGVLMGAMLANVENDDGSHRLVDVTTNDTILEGYDNYTVMGSLDTTLRVYASASDSETTDIYFLSMK